MTTSRNVWVQNCCALFSGLVLFPLSISAQQYVDGSGRVSVVIVADPYSDTRTGPELVEGPGLLLAGGIEELLAELGADVVSTTAVQMPAELEREYGEWHRASLTESANSIGAPKSRQKALAWPMCR